VISKSQVKDIRALASAKGRQQQQCFLVEGDKLAREWLASSHDIRLIAATKVWLQGHEALLHGRHGTQTVEISSEDLARISTKQTPNEALLVVRMPAAPERLPASEWCIALDTLQDPGNLGTIIRIADWFGIGHVVCSPGCADVYNPKVVASAMGGHLRVQLHQASLEGFLQQCDMPVFAATLHGRPMQEFAPQQAAALLIGNESQGIRPSLLSLATHVVSIPGKGGAESLNAAVSAGILAAVLFGA
jgi:TrmH family RNA methyltransferase